MSNSKCTTAERLLAVLLVMVMVFSMLPSAAMTVSAATTEHPDAVTVTVKDEEGQAIQGASVTFSIHSVLNGRDYIQNTLETDANGTVEILKSDAFVADDLSFEATVTANDYYTTHIAEQLLLSADQNLDTVLVCKTIKDVTITWHENCRYNGTAQALVSVSAAEGDTVTYEIDGAPVAKPEKTDAGEYDVKVTVERSGKDPLVATKVIEIETAALEIGLKAATELTYNNAEQALVTVPTGIALGDKVTWKVNGNLAKSTYTVDTTNINYVPTAENVGSYKIDLTVERNANYAVFHGEVTAEIAASNIDGLSAKLAEGLVYTGKEQILLAKNDSGEYISGLEKDDVVYFIVGTDNAKVMSSTEWVKWEKESLPVGTNAGNYTVRIKVVRANYNDAEITLDPAEVTIAKADQKLVFKNYPSEENSEANPKTIELSGSVPYDKCYDFSATDESKLCDGKITYSVFAEEDVAVITEEGLLTVYYPGNITVIATLAGNENCNECVARYYLDVRGVKGAEGDFIRFENSKIDYVLGTSDIISNQVALKKDSKIDGEISYSISDTFGGAVKLDSKTAELSVADYDKLAAAIQKANGELEIVVKATKAAEGHYAEDQISYTVEVSFATTPKDPYSLEGSKNESDWYNTAVIVKPTAGYSIAASAGSKFGESVSFSDQGEITKTVYLRNLQDGGITDCIQIDLKIDTEAPNNITIEYHQSSVEGFVKVITFAFYSKSAKIYISAVDDASGIDHFTWKYVGTKSSNSHDGGDIPAIREEGSNKYTANFELDGSLQYNGGYLSVSAVDKAGNIITEDDSDSPFVIDSIAPTIKVEYNNKSVVKTVDKAEYYASSRTATIIVTDSNLNTDDIELSITAKDVYGNSLEEAYQAEEWVQKGNSYLKTIVFSGDANYTLKIKATDLAGNESQYDEDCFTIDTTAPQELSMTIISPAKKQSVVQTVLSVLLGGTNYYSNEQVEVQLSAKDATSGVDYFVYSCIKADRTSEENRSLQNERAEVTGYNEETGQYTAMILLPKQALGKGNQFNGTVEFYAVDYAGNKSDKNADNTQIIVDNLPPVLTVDYNDCDGFDEETKTSYYKKDVVVSLKINEANFDAEDVTVSYTKDEGEAQPVKVDWSGNTNNDDHTACFTLPEDGDYVISVNYTDKSGNNLVLDEKSKASGSVTNGSYASNPITIDKIAPVVDVEYDNADGRHTAVRSESDRQYFATAQKATITVTEHNFNEVDFAKALHITAKNVEGTFVETYAIGQWSHENDKHTVEIEFFGDANYTFSINYADPAENSATSYNENFSVDINAPTDLKVSYEECERTVMDSILNVLFGYYKEKMRVTISATDSGIGIDYFVYSYKKASGVSYVNAERINERIDVNNSNSKTVTATFEIPKEILGSNNQFNGTVEFCAVDRSGNTSETFTDGMRVVVDSISPTAEVKYNAPVNVENGISYYNGSIQATVTINEANFDASDVSIFATKDGGAQTAVSTTWEHENADVHVGSFTLAEDGDYFVTIRYQDKSGNAMSSYESEQMTVDTSIEAPTILINGVEKAEEGGAYNDKATVVFGFTDQNFDSVSVKLTRTRLDLVEDVTEEYIQVKDQEKGGSGTFSIPSLPENDGIYVLTIEIADKAKHTAVSETKFTLNRYGSVYEYGTYLASLIKDGGQYITRSENDSAAITQDLVITEYNADRILADSLNIMITRNGEAIDAVYTTEPESINEEVEIGESGWYQYRYVISAANFQEDGIYRIALSSAYATSDSARNDSSSVPENSVDTLGNPIVDTMSFTVDTTAPEIRNIVNLEKSIINAQSIEVKYTIVDVGGLSSIKVILDGKTIDTITEFDDDAFNYVGQFTINEKNGRQSVQIVVTDLAGNVTDTASDSFTTGDRYVFHDRVTVSSYFFVRWYANKALFWGSVGGAVVIAAAVILFVTKRRKKAGV